MAEDTKPTVHSHEGEHHDDINGTPVKITRATKLFALCAALNSCNLGYDIGVSTEAGFLIQEDFNLTRIQRELFVGSINFWAMFGSLLSHYISDTFGRRRTFIVAAISFIIGLLVMSFSNTYGFLMFGRIFVGLGVGVGFAIDPVYISEMSPASRRGELVTWSEIATNLGIVLGFSTGLFLAPIDDGREWRFMFWIGLIMPVLMIFLATKVMPETPRWLVAHSRHDDARIVLKQIYPEGFDVEPVISDIQEALEREEAAEKAVGWNIILSPTPAFRRVLMIGVGIAIAQQAVGIDAIQYYLLDTLRESGVENDQKRSLLLVFLGGVKLFFVFVSGMLFDKIGRRILLFTSLLGMVVALSIVSLGFVSTDDPATGFIVFGLGLYLAAFSIGMGPGAWLIPSEIFCTSIRSKAMSVATFMNRGAATVMSSTFLSIVNGIGKAGFFAILIAVCVIVFGFLFAYLPETKGRSLEDMSIYFAEVTNDTSILEAEERIRGGGAVEMNSAPISPVRPEGKVV